jgi:hypothetical protein
MMRTFIIAATFASCLKQLGADEVIPPANERFAAEAPHVPDFQRHVIPLLGRLGCNGRACHGSFQGQGGFRLSLFGYDFAADHAALTGGESPRIDLERPAESLILQKPTLAIEHEGGERFASGGWEHRLLRRWVEEGAPPVAAEAAVLESLQISPAEITFDGEEDSQPLRVIAVWSDGAREDVTPLSRFRSNDESIATVSDSGVAAAAGRGATHIIAFYDNGIVAVPVIVPVSEETGTSYPEVATPTRIDELVVQKLRKVGMVPSAPASDAEFLRRASLDVAGTLPAPREIESFLADASSDKRARKIEELLMRPSYAAWWATRLGDWTGNAEQNLPVGGEQGVRKQKSAQWYDWLYRRLDENVPYDKIVAGILLAVGREGDLSDDEYFAQTSAYFRRDDPADFAARETMPHFWSPGLGGPSQTLRVSYAFLGVRLECAECHKHPYDQWTKEDYEGFQVFFDGVRFRQTGNRGAVQEMKKSLGLTADPDSGGYKRLFADLAAKGVIVPWGEVAAPDWRRTNRKDPAAGIKNRAGRVITPKLLGGEALIAGQYGDPREPVLEWLRATENPYFARALVNRVWANYFGAGIVEPPDDMNLANPASNEPLLAYLASEFIAHGYDLKWLHREIAGSRTYQLSWRPNTTNVADERNFSRAPVRRLPAEVAYDAVVFATAADETLQALQTDPATVRDRAIGVSTGYSRSTEGDYALKLFGKPPRTLTCDCERSAEPSLLQTVYLRNDPELLALLDRKDGWLKQIASRGEKWLSENQEQLIRETYLRTLSRPPKDEERGIAREHLAESASIESGLRDLLWALVNSKEFILNH